MTNTPDNSRLDRIERILEQVAQQQQQFAQQQQQTNQQFAQQQQELVSGLNLLTSRFDGLVNETQRVLNGLAERQTRTEAAVESVAESVARLTRNAEADRAYMTRMSAEIRQIWEYLLNQRGNGHQG